jgi:cell division control protein 6
MKNLFEDQISEGGIFANKEALRPTYTPETLPHREKHITGLAEILSAALKGKATPNVLIYGNRGTGKTSTVKYVCGEFEEMARKTDSNCSLLYINSEVFDTQYRVLAYIARVFNKRVPMIGWPTDLVYSVLKKEIDAEERHVIVTLDELDQLANKEDETLHNLLKINGELNNAHLSVIGISNDPAFKDFLDPGVKSSLSEEELLFSPYSAEQLEDILYARAEMAFTDVALDDMVIPRCTALAASKQGDAKYALDLLRISGENAERSRSKKVREEHVQLASEMIQADNVAEDIKTLPLHSKIVLSSVLLLSRDQKKRGFSSGEVYSMYQRLCHYLGTSALTSRRVTDFVSELDILGLLNAAIVNKGRYGRTKVISLGIPEEYVQQVLFGDYKLRALANISEIAPIPV